MASMNKLLIPLGSLALIGFLVWLAYLMGFRGGRRISGETELLALAGPHGGTQQFLLDTKGASAIALLKDGQLMAAKIVGEQVVTRIFPISALMSIKQTKSKPDQNLAIELRFKDFGFAPVCVETNENHLPSWLEQLQLETSNS
jgi:hypothetical protein